MTELPGYFEDVVLDDLVVLIGEWFMSTHSLSADLLLY
jgi:hypothetical protein